MTDSDNLFDDVPTNGASEGESKTFTEVSQEPEVAVGEEPEEEAPAEEEENTGDEEEVVPPTTAQTDEEPTEKLIPEHRFKAALKDVTDKYEKAKQELEQLKATPAPNRDEDPEGYELHVRIETSKAVMRSTHDDYDEKIAHYNEMTKVNPLLNQVVAAHPVPAQHAYNLAKEDMQIQSLKKLTSSDEWKEFQEFKKQKGQTGVQKSSAAAPVKKVTPTVPNLNRSTSISGGRASNDTSDDDLFKGAL